MVLKGFYQSKISPGGLMKEKCGTLLIAQRGCELAQDLDPWLKEQGHRCKKVDSIKDVLMTL